MRDIVYRRPRAGLLAGAITLIIVTVLGSILFVRSHAEPAVQAPPGLL